MITILVFKLRDASYEDDEDEDEEDDDEEDDSQTPSLLYYHEDTTHTRLRCSADKRAHNPLLL